MHIDPIEINYHPTVYSGASHKLAINFDNIPLVQRLFRMGYCDFGAQDFTVLSLFPFNVLSPHSSAMFAFKFELLTINHELDYNTFYSLN